MLTITNLNKRYGKFQALTNLNLHIPKGEIFGFVGPNGAGKTTTMRIVCGLLQATSGQVFVDGVDALNHPKQIKSKVGYVPDFFGVYDNFKVMEYMEFYGSMYGISRAQVLETSRGLLDLVNLADKSDVYVDSLSRGMKQRLCVARALIHDPQLLILDEPASGLDPRARYEMKEIMKNLGSMGKTIIISSHILPELAEMCTSVGVMERGKLVVCGRIDDILKSQKLSQPIHLKVVNDKDVAVNILKENPLVTKLSIQEDTILITFNGEENEMSQLLKSLIGQNIQVADFHREKGDLESLFLQLTGNGGN